MRLESKKEAISCWMIAKSSLARKEELNRSVDLAIQSVAQGYVQLGRDDDTFIPLKVEPRQVLRYIYIYTRCMPGTRRRD